MRFLSCFSGIGGMDLGLEWAGWECVGQIENEPYCRKVLKNTGRMCRCLETYAMLHPKKLPQTVGDLTPLSAVSPARTSALRGKAQDLTGHVVACGGKCGDLSAQQDQSGCLLRTALLCVIEGMTPYSLCWQRQTTPNGHSWWKLSTVEPRKRGSGLLLWATPTASASPPAKWKPGVIHRKQSRASRGLEAQIIAALPWATPTARDWKGGGQAPFAFPVGRNQPQYEWEAPRTTVTRMGVTTNGLPFRLAIRGIGNAMVPQVAYVVAMAVSELRESLKCA